MGTTSRSNPRAQQPQWWKGLYDGDVEAPEGYPGPHVSGYMRENDYSWTLSFDGYGIPIKPSTPVTNPFTRHASHHTRFMPHDMRVTRQHAAGLTHYDTSVWDPKIMVMFTMGEFDLEVRVRR